MGDDNIWTDEWDASDDWSGGGARSKRLPRGDGLGATVYELDPGATEPIRRGPYRFASAHEAFRFVQEAMLAFEYLGCTIG